MSEPVDSSSNLNEPKTRKKKDVPRYQCTFKDCISIFSRPYRLAAHLKVHAGEKPFSCKIDGCGKSYTNNAHLSRHLKTAHEDRSSPNKDYKCPQCSKVFWHCQNLKRHIVRKHQSDFPYRCTVCQLGFSKKSVFAAHNYMHTGIESFKCDLCDKTFPNQTERYRHRSHHKSYKCHCGQVFTRWTAILKHKKEAHLSNEFICDICKKKFQSRAYILRHMKTHDTSEVYPCPYSDCVKFYTLKFNLIHHVQAVHKEKTFDCNLCEAKLSTQDKLNFHIDKHENPTIKTKKKGKRKPRKDIGSKKRSLAVKLSGLSLPLSVERQLIERRSIVINPETINDPSECSDSPFDAFGSDTEMKLINHKTIYVSS